MSISSSGFNINFNPTPSIYEKETQGAVDLQKKGDLGQGSAIILPQAQQDLIPFTKLNDRNLWHYKAESDRPSLLPVGFLRSAGPESREGEAKWSTFFNHLLDALPKEIQEAIKENPSLATGSLVVALETASKALEWLANTSQVANSENAQNRTKANLVLPEMLFFSSLGLGKELAGHMEEWLNEIGPNDPNYSEAQDYLSSFQLLMREVKSR